MKYLFILLWITPLLPDCFYGTVRAQNSDTAQRKSTIPLSKDALKETIQFEAADSVRIDIKRKRATLFNKTKVVYEDVELTSDHIHMDLDSQVVYATGAPDSNGVIQGKPEFKQKSSTFYANSIGYNLQSKQGIVYNVITQEGDGILHGEVIKKVNDSVTFVRRGVYTTCNLEHPHFGFVFTKGKVIPHDVIVTKFIHPEIRDIPIPVGLPFSLLPNSAKKRKNGILTPTYGESAELGFYLQGVGIYYAFNDCIDLALTTDLYLRGSFAVNLNSNYYRRYKYKGNFYTSYSLTRRGEPKTPTYYTAQDVRVTWKHSQDSKAHPTNRFSADVNYQTSSYNKNNITDLNNYVNSNYNSTVSFSTSFGSLHSLGINASLSQNVSTGVINLNLPNVNYNISTFYPLRRKEIVGKIRWYENISLSYNLSMSNSVQTTDSLFMKPAMFDKMRSGMTHSIPLSSTIKVLKHIDWNNTINWTENWQFKGAYRRYAGTDSLHNAIIARDTVFGFFATHQMSYSSTLRTTLYGMFQYKGNWLKAMRHEITPSASFTYSPFINRRIFDSYLDSTTGQTITYAPIEGFLYGTPADRSSAFASFSIGNKLEMKVRKRKDTSENGIDKVTLLESLNLSTSYNMMADSMNWTPVTVSGRTTLFKKIYLNFNIYFDPYVISDAGIRTNQFEWEKNHRLFRLSSTAANLSFSYQLGPSNFKRWNTGESAFNWNLSLSYSLNYNLSDNYNYYNMLVLDRNRYNKTVTNTVNINGRVDVTRKWAVGFTSGYDFTTKQVSASSFDITRDLHCWTMSFQWRPFGYYRGFQFHINVKASTLQSLKWNVNKDYTNY
ncbi:MAG: hypothetical protein K6C07_08025 [Bacteroidales bacterium]|nr:hypothetical protein [Bacteroidales bacterium]